MQDAFQRFLVAGDASIETHVVGTQRVSVAARLAIYGDGYRTRLIEALQATFPVLADLLGETDFETLGARYVALHESSFFSIRYYGDEVADFLANDADYACAPVLAELARWEWAMAAVFDAADAPPVEVDAFAGLAPESWSELRFEWSPSVQVLALQWNVPELWKTVTQDTQRPDPELRAQPVSWLLWRRELQIYFRPLGEEEAAVIAASRKGKSFGELCVLLCAQMQEQEASARAAAFLRDWVQSGLIVGMRLPP